MKKLDYASSLIKRRPHSRFSWIFASVLFGPVLWCGLFVFCIAVGDHDLRSGKNTQRTEFLLEAMSYPTFPVLRTLPPRIVHAYWEPLIVILGFMTNGAIWTTAAVFLARIAIATVHHIRAKAKKIGENKWDVPDKPRNE